MRHRHPRHALLPHWAHPGWLLLAMMAAGVVASPFYWLWHPLGWAVAVVAMVVAFALLVAAGPRRGRRVVVGAQAQVRVRSRRG